MSELYVREITLSEVKQAAETLTRGFASDPAFNWYGCVPEKNLVKDLDNPDQNAHRTLAGLRAIHSLLLKCTFAVGGVVTAVAIPNTEPGGEERLAAVCLWLKPGQSFDFPLPMAMRFGGLSVLRYWGLHGLKRMTLDFVPTVQKTLKKAFKARNLDPLQSWHLLEIAVDPDFQGQGLSSRLMEDGFKRTTPTPVHLEATTAKSRDIYAHYGFEINEDHIFGKGAVDSRGLPASGEKATGYPEWIMTKWTS